MESRRRPGGRTTGPHSREAVLLASLYGVHRSGLRPSQRELAVRTGLEALYVSKPARTPEAEGLIERHRGPADTRAVQLALTTEGREVTGRAIAVVHQLLDQLMSPLGGCESERSEVFVRELTALLDAPLDQFHRSEEER